MLRVAMLLAVVLLAAIVVGWREIPRWQAGGAQPVPAASVGWGRDRIACPAPGRAIAIYGDSHVKGSRSEAGAQPFGKVLEAALGGRVGVALHGVGGDTAEMGERRWQGSRDAAKLVIIGYGTNDAAPRGWLRSKEPVGTARYAASLQRQIDRWHGAGRDVILLAPPPPASTAMMRRIAPYRRAMSDLGQARGIAVLDPADAFASCSEPGPLLGYDGLHMTAAGHECLGTWLAAQICPS